MDKHRMAHRVDELKQLVQADIHGGSEFSIIDKNAPKPEQFGKPIKEQGCE